MKNKFIAPILACLAVLLVASFSAFRADNSSNLCASTKSKTAHSASPTISVPVNGMTQSRTRKATRASCRSRCFAWQYDVRTILTNVSGTRSVKINLDESGSASGSDWLSIDSVTVTGTSIAAPFTNSTTYGRRHCIRLSGTTGTMVVKYKVIANYKRRE